MYNSADAVCVELQEALHREPCEPHSRRIKDGRTAVPSQAMIKHWNKAEVSDSVVLFLRAVTAVHILQHPSFHQDNYMADIYMADIKG